MSTEFARPSRALRSRFATLAAVCFLIGACGGDADPATTGDGADVSESGGGASTDSGEATGGVATGDALAFDASALGTGALDLTDIRVYEPNVEVTRIVPVDAVVNTCDALGGGELSSIVQTLSEEEALGNGPVFPDGELLGAACTYRSDTHAIRVIVAPADQATVDSADLIADFFAGDITATPWATDPTITIFSEDSFDLDTPFGAHGSAGDVGILVHNAAGTGIDFGSDGELFARVAAAVVANVGAAGPAVPVDDSLNIQTARPCALYEPDELAAFFTDASLVAPPEGALETAIADTECLWGDDFNGVSVRIDIEHASTADDRTGLDPSSVSTAVFTDLGLFGHSYVVTDIATVRVRLDVATADGSRVETDVSAASRAIAENIAARLGL